MAEEEANEVPILRLVMLQGPRQGETIDFPPGTAIRIGRVVRGNTLTIKDSGISSKHLSILTESSQWLLRDLDSSNGTVFDDSKIPPHTPFPLRHGSTIKIGELTSIQVIFLPHHHLQHPSYVRRNPTRRGRTKPDDDSSEPVSKSVRGTGTGRGRGRGRGKGLKGKGLKGRVQIQSIDENVSLVGDESEHVAPPVRTRVTRNSKRKQSEVTVSDSSIENLEKVGEEHKGTRNPSLIEISDSSLGNSDRKITPAATEIEGGDGNGGLCSVNETCDGSEKENLDGDDGHGNWPDLEKMSLGEWFDFLEVHLPKQIIDATEEMIQSMTQKAERLREYIEMTQQNHKAKMPVEE